MLRKTLFVLALGKVSLCAKGLFCGNSTRGAGVLAVLILGLVAQQAQAAEATWEYSVQVSAAVQTSPPQIILSWPQDTIAVPGSYTIYRKGLDSTSWGEGTTLPGTATAFVDTHVAVGSGYEYQIVKDASGYTGYGYIYAGIDVPLVEDRGKVSLVVDNTYAADLAAELSRLEQDLRGDGWQVLRHDVARDETATNVKALIKADYDADPASVKAVFLLGRIPVVRSGSLNVDGHASRPMPADVFYGDMAGPWIDSDGDGIYDHNSLPSDVELAVGRVDFANMPGRLTWGGPPTFPSELELLRRYLDKDHNFRHGRISAPRRALVGDGFGVRSGEAFAVSGYRNFAALVGAANVDTANTDDGALLEDRWISMLATNRYLWAYGCGGGSSVSISGLGSHQAYNDVWSTDLVKMDAKAVFTMMFGSWFGDWDSEDNVMRAMLATPTMGLTCSWAGRPHDFYHHMGLGETIGYGIRLSQNNGGLYRNQVNRYTRGIHIALMGDPTLRMHPVAPPSDLIGTASPVAVSLTWAPSTDPVAGYHVYRAANVSGPFIRLTSSQVVDPGFVDTSVTEGTYTYTYMVRAVKREETASGSYVNASQGIFLTAAIVPLIGLPAVTVEATDAEASEDSFDPAVFTFTRTGSTTSALTVNYNLTGTGAKSDDYPGPEGGTPDSVTIPAGATSAKLTIYPAGERGGGPPQDVVLTLVPESAYRVGTPESATITITSNPLELTSIGRESDGAMQLTWNSEPGKLYRIVFKDSLTDADWTDLSNDIVATDSSTSWIDNTAAGFSRRFYRVRPAD